MSGEASWITLAILLVGAAFVVGLAWVGLATKGFRRAKASVECPTTKHGATIVTLTSETSGRATDVVSCSELKGNVTCDRACLAQVNAPQVNAPPVKA